MPARASTRLRVCVAAALAVNVTAMSARGAGQFAPAFVDMRAAEWRVAARAHVSGQFDEAAASVAGWPPELTRVVVDRVIRRARERAPALDDGSGGSDLIYRQIESLLSHDYHYWLQRGSLEVEHGDLRRAELFLNQARGIAPQDFRVDTEYGYLLMRKGIEAPHDSRAASWVDEGSKLLEAVISSRGDIDDYAYHVLGTQGLAWARRSRTREEKRRLLMYYDSIVQQGVQKHPLRRDLVQLRKDIQKDLLLTAVN